jgi:ribosomal protein S27E
MAQDLLANGKNNPDNVPKWMVKSCRICGGKHWAKGLCQIHYQQEYRNNPENKAKIKQYIENPDTKARIREYRKRPYVRKKHKIWMREYNKRPEVITRRRVWQKKYYKIPENYARRRAWAEKYYQNPEVKAWRNEYSKKYSKDNKEKIREIRKRYFKKHPNMVALRAKKNSFFCPNCSSFTMTSFHHPKEVKCSLCGNIIYNPKIERVAKKEIYKSRESYLKNNKEVKA